MKHKKPFKFGIRWKEPLGMPYCPYMYRWVFNFKLFSIRIHHWIRSDDKRAFHSHPWNFITFVIKGSYIDVTPEGKETLKFGSIRYRKNHHMHYVDVPKTGCWSILLTGNPNFKWGFLVNNKFIRKDKYFKKYGHPPCYDQ